LPYTDDPNNEIEEFQIPIRHFELFASCALQLAMNREDTTQQKPGAPFARVTPGMRTAIEFCFLSPSAACSIEKP